jgi:hypothetical protein
MAKSNGLKMTRQLQIYDLIDSVHNGAVYSPDEIMASFGISRRMLQRDLKDIRDCGLISVTYDKSEDRYVLGEDPVFDKEIPTRRKQHLIRLYRIGTLIHSLSRTSTDDLERYEYGVKEYEEYLEDAKEDPENNSPEVIEDMREFYIPQDFEFYNLKAEYYALFPESNERTRQRDFEEMNRAGFNIYYSRKHRSFIYEYDCGI